MHLLLRPIRALIATAIVSLSLQQTSVGQQFVTIDATGFQPSLVTTTNGGAVLWFNLDPGSAHTTTSDRPSGNPDYWNASLNSGNFYTRTFPRPGLFTYHDNVTGHTGTVIVADPAGPHLDAPSIVTGQLVFIATGLTAGKTNVLQASTNLTSWISLQTNTTASSYVNFTNPASGTRGFYRLIEWR